MPETINMLTDVRTAEVSLVRRGANNKRFALTKEDRTMKFTELLSTVLDTKAEGEDQMVETLKSAGANDEAVEVAVAQFRIQSGFQDKFSKEQFAIVAKAAGFETGKAEDEEEDPEKPGFLRNGKRMKAKKSHVPVDMPEAVQKRFDEQEATNVALAKEVKDGAAKVIALEKEAVRKEFVAKCQSDYAHVPGQSVEEMGKMLHDAYEVSKDFGEKLENQWKLTSEAIEKSSLLSAQGSAHSPQGGSALGRVESIAKEYQSKDPSLTIEKAKALAYERNPELYSEYMADNPAQRGGR